MLQINHVVCLKNITVTSFPLFSELGDRVVEAEEFKANVFQISTLILRTINPLWSLEMSKLAVDVSSEGTLDAIQFSHIILYRTASSLVRGTQGADGRVKANLRFLTPKAEFLIPLQLLHCSFLITSHFSIQERNTMHEMLLEGIIPIYTQAQFAV